jgi:hypothetical protein
MRRPSRFFILAGHATLAPSLLVVCLASACDNSDSIGRLGGRNGGSSGTGGAAPAGAGGGAGGAKTGAGGTGSADAATDAYVCPLTNVYCPNGYMTDAYGCQVCAPYGTGGNGGGSAATGTGGAGSGGSGGTTAKGGVGGTSSGGRGGTTAKGGSGGGGGADGALDGHECPPITDVYCPTYILDAYGCMICATGTGGSGGTTGKGGAGGIGGQGGTTSSGGTGGTVDAGGDGTIVCGTATCGAGEWCCNSACSMCVPVGITGCGPCPADAAAEADGNGCTAYPEGDATFCGGSKPPHYYTCIMTMLAAPCMISSIGDMTNTFCCP